MGVINNVLKPSLVQTHTKLHVYKTLAWPVLRYGREARTLREWHINRISAWKMIWLQE